MVISLPGRASAAVALVASLVLLAPAHASQPESAASDRPAACHPPIGHPVVTSVRASASRVDVRKHSTTVTVTIKAHDTSPSPQPIDRFQVSIDYGGGDILLQTLRRVGGSRSDGTWQESFPISRWEGAHPRVIADVYVFGTAGGYAHYTNGPAWSGDAGPWGSSWSREVKVIAATPERTRPTLASWSYSPHELSTRRAPGVVRFTVKASDTGSGVGAVTVLLGGNPQTRLLQLHLTGGNHHQGTWTGALSFGRRVGKVLGYSIDAVSVSDRFGNEVHIQPKDRWLIVHGVPDHVAPVMHALSVSSTRVDSRQEYKLLTFHAVATDADSGMFSFNVTLRHGNDRYSGDFALVPGTTDHYVSRLLIQQCGDESGAFAVTVTAMDNSFNQATYHRAQLSRHHWPPTIYIKVLDDTP
jgi:hypothetical protein